MSESSAVGVIGDGPAIEAVTAALDDGDARVEPVESRESGAVELAVVAASAGDPRFEQVNDVRSGRWIAIELGGVGGEARPGVDAAVSVLEPAGPCYECLRTRVDSAAENAAGGSATIARADARLAGAHGGRLALELLSETASIGVVIELPYERRRLLPVPGCACRSPGDGSIDRAYDSVSLEATMQRAEGAIDPRFGPVTSIGEVDSFPAPYYLASVADTSGFSEVQASRQAAGVASDWNPAFVKAVGEALERYSAGVYRRSSFTHGSTASLENAVAPSAFVRPEVDPPPQGDEEAIEWVRGVDLHGDTPVYLPADRIHFPPAVEQVGPPITTGLGLGTSGAGALVSGLTEVIERDATMLGWYSTFEPLGLSIDSPDYERLRRRARSEDLEVTAMLMTQDVDVPVVTVAVHREGAWPRFAVGSGADIDPVAAAAGALEEALQNWMELRGMGQEGAAEEEPDLARYAEFPPEARGFLENTGRAVPAESVGPEEPPTGGAVFPTLLERVADVGLTAYAASLTTRDLRQLGFETVRVVVPEAQPLFTGDRFFGERARTVPRELGFRPRLDRPAHPYP